MDAFVAKPFPRLRYPEVVHSSSNHMFCSGRDHFTSHQHVKRYETCVSGLNALFRGTEVANMVSQRKHPIYSIIPKMKFCSGQDHFTNHQHVKRYETCVSGLNALFWGTEVANMVAQRKHPCYSNRPKMMCGSIWEHFTNLGHTKDAKLVFRA